MKMKKREREAVAGFLQALRAASEMSDRARIARERLIERTRAEPERVLTWLAALPEGEERASDLLSKLRLIATTAVFEKMQKMQSSGEEL